MLGIYIHIPFCEKKCSYCNFYSIALNSDIEEKYVDALTREIEFYKKENRKINSLYFGGGTPSILNLKNIEKIMIALKNAFKFSENTEITIEINPNTATLNKLKYYKELGINRISFGVQSFIDNELKKLERTHNKTVAIKAIENALTCGFNNISIDLMLGIPFQTKESLFETLKIATNFNINHISLYHLKIEPNTKFFKFPPKNLMSPDDVANLYLLACEFLESKNFKQYEISNFAKGNKESIHNLKYWTLEEYLGFGPSAHSFYNNKRFYHEDSLINYIKNPLKTAKEEKNLEFEWLILNLRLKKGISIKELKNKKFYTKDFEEKILKLKKENLLEIKNNKLTLTPKGMLLQNSIILFIT